MPERFEIYIVNKWRYINTLFPFLSLRSVLTDAFARVRTPSTTLVLLCTFFVHVAAVWRTIA